MFCFKFFDKSTIINNFHAYAYYQIYLRPTTLFLIIAGNLTWTPPPTMSRVKVSNSGQLVEMDQTGTFEGHSTALPTGLQRRGSNLSKTLGHGTEHEADTDLT